MSERSFEVAQRKNYVNEIELFLQSFSSYFKCSDFALVFFWAATATEKEVTHSLSACELTHLGSLSTFFKSLIIILSLFCAVWRFLSHFVQLQNQIVIDTVLVDHGYQHSEKAKQNRLYATNVWKEVKPCVVSPLDCSKIKMHLKRDW